MKHMYVWCSLMAALLFGMTNATAQNLTVEGNVGIGNTTPSAPLHVTAASTVEPPENGIYIYNPNTAATDNAILSTRVNGSTGAGGNPFVSWDIEGFTGWSMGIDNDDGDKLKIVQSWRLDEGNSSNTFLTIEQSGDVGIGTTDPTATLDIDGRIRIRNMPGIFPNAQSVVVDPDGNLGVVTFSPNLIRQDVDNLQEENKHLKARLEELEQLVNVLVANTTSMTPTRVSVTDATLQQNAPNPFTEATTINYFIPETVKSASLQVMDQNGRIIKTIPIQATGNGQLTLQANLLSAGTYSYSLILDGQVMETKQMVLTH